MAVSDRRLTIFFFCFIYEYTVIDYKSMEKIPLWKTVFLNILKSLLDSRNIDRCIFFNFWYNWMENHNFKFPLTLRKNIAKFFFFTWKFSFFFLDTYVIYRKQIYLFSNKFLLLCHCRNPIVCKQNCIRTNKPYLLY